MYTQHIFLTSLYIWGLKSQYKEISAAACLSLWWHLLLFVYLSPQSLQFMLLSHYCIFSLCFYILCALYSPPSTFILSVVSLAFLVAPSLFPFSYVCSPSFPLPLSPPCCLHFVFALILSLTLPHLFFSVSGFVLGLKKGNSLLLSV